jgi:hypothetical protein
MIFSGNEFLRQRISELMIFCSLFTRLHCEASWGVGFERLSQRLLMGSKRGGERCLRAPQATTTDGIAVPEAFVPVPEAFVPVPEALEGTVTFSLA